VDDSFWPDILAPGCFADDLPVFLAEGFVSGINHDWCQPIGKPLEARETPDGLFVRASISDTTAGRDVRTLLRDGVVKRLSIGFRVLGRTWLETSADVTAWWQTVGYSPTPDDLAKAADGVRLVTRARLYEFGPVAVPANKGAVITAVKASGEASRSLEDQARAVLVAADELVERLEVVSELRASKGRHLGEERQAEVKRLIRRFERLLGADDAEKASTDAGQLYADFLAIQSRQHGLRV